MQCQDNVSTGRTAEESLFVLVRLFKLGPYEETFIIEYDRGHCGQVAISEVVKSAETRLRWWQASSSIYRYVVYVICRRLGTPKFDEPRTYTATRSDLKLL